MVLVELEPGVEFRDQWHRTATQLGYTVKQLDADESLPGWPKDAWTLRLAETEDSADRPTWKTKVRNTVARLAKTLRVRLSE